MCKFELAKNYACLQNVRGNRADRHSGRQKAFDKLTNKMKNTFSALFLLLISFSCGNFHNSNKFAKIDLSTIEVAEIKKSLYDTISVRLSDKQTEKFVEYINTTKDTELLKAMPQYWIFVKFKPDSVKLYKIHYDLIGDGDSYIKIADTCYFKDIYENNSKGPHFISVENGLP